MELSFESMVSTLYQAAKKGLSIFYSGSGNLLPYANKLGDNHTRQLQGFSMRYAAISQIGISRWLKYYPDDKEHLPKLWPRILERFDEITCVGDLALLIWASVESGDSRCERFSKVLAQYWKKQRQICNSVELGWVVQACTLIVCKANYLESYVKPILDEAHQCLINRFNQKQNLFRRHDRVWPWEIISKRVACFADQVYPVVALSTYGMLFGDEQSVDFAARAVDRMCQFQGALGQWHWHYDVASGKICEEYPIFSVHQDSMAPMAILSSDRASGENHLEQIELSMRWLFGDNELRQSLVLEDDGVIWRDIERRELGKFSRIVRGLCSVLELSSLHRLAGRCFNTFIVNHECRPYHLGWILYTWADFKKGNDLR